MSPVSRIDLYPTGLDYAELPTSHKLDGFTLRPLLENPPAGKWSGPSMTIAASASTVPVEQNRPAKADDQHFRIRAERYRYIRCRNGEEELYDHLEDPYEWKNLAEDPEQSRVLNAMRKQMKNYIQAHRQPQP